MKPPRGPLSARKVWGALGNFFFRSFFSIGTPPRWDAKNRDKTVLIRPHYLTLIGLHFYLDHGFDGQVRSQRTHVLQPARGIFAHLRLPTTLPLLQDSSGQQHENRHRAANADRTRGLGCLVRPWAAR